MKKTKYTASFFTVILTFTIVASFSMPAMIGHQRLLATELLTEAMSGNATETELHSEGTTVRDSVAVPLQGLTIPANGFIHLYDTTPYVINNGHVAVNVPCGDDSAASLNVLIGQAPNLTGADLEYISELSNPGQLCLYHV
jgi:hypothetical protein